MNTSYHKESITMPKKTKSNQQDEIPLLNNLANDATAN